MHGPVQLEILNDGAGVTLREIGAWIGDTQLSADVVDHGKVVPRVLLGPRVNGSPYDETSRERLGRAVTTVGLALDREADHKGYRAVHVEARGCHFSPVVATPCTK